MALQTENFVMIGLGILGDTPPNSLQPPLADGIHLRWAFKRELGFPWFGFYLFRRPHRKLDHLCLRWSTENLSVGRWPASNMHTPHGDVRSDQNLVLTDDFSPAGLKEFDLLGRSYLRFAIAAGELAHSAEVTIGFRDSGKATPRTDCVKFADRLPRAETNPLIDKAVNFVVMDFTGNQAVETRIMNMQPGGPVGLFCEAELQIRLPRPLTWVELKLSHFAAAGKVEAFDAAGRLVETVQMGRNIGALETIRLSAADISSVIIRAAQTETLLHEICFEQAEAPDPKASEIRVKAFHGNVQVDQLTITGQPGDVVSALLEADAISLIEIDSGNAALVDICYEPIVRDALAGWEPLPEFRAPLCLPLTHPDYPCSGGTAIDEVAAEARALGRILYGESLDFAGAPFSELHQELLKLVVGGPSSLPMANRKSSGIVATPIPADPSIAAPEMSDQYPLDLVLLGALNPAIAQMAGLYWVDQTAQPDQAYDYLIVADYLGRGKLSAEKMLAWIGANGFADVEAYIVYDKEVRPATPPATPKGVKVYALPGGTRRKQDGTLDDATNSAGLQWQADPIALANLQLEQAIMFHVWRASLGNDVAPAVPVDYDPITKSGPVIVVGPRLPPAQTPQRATDWPPFPLHHLDNGLVDGWYGYQISGQDIFGRHSANSEAGSWNQWMPRPEPRPWYYQDPESATELHPSAVRLLDKTPPPPPPGIEAHALEPWDPTLLSQPRDLTLLRDHTYNDWWATLNTTEQTSVVGLRVRWLWTFAQMSQAPDTREFRIYYHPGPTNALLGRTLSVDAASDRESFVETDTLNTHSLDAFIGAWLRIGSDSFVVTASEAANPLRLRVKNLGPTYTAGTVSIVQGAASVSGHNTSWHAGLAGLSLQLAGETKSYSILNVESPTQLTLTELYSGATGSGKSYVVFDRLPQANRLCTVVIPESYGKGWVSLAAGSPAVIGDQTGWNSGLAGMKLVIEGDLASYRIQTVDSPTRITLTRNYEGSTDSGKAYRISHPLHTDYALPTSWEDRYYVVDYNEHVTPTVDEAGRPLRVYEVLLPAAGDAFRGGVSLSPSLAEPVAYAQVGVSAADDKLHTADDPKWMAGRWGGRFGNEGSVGPRATIFRVLRNPPPAPNPPADSERVFATPADYHSQSFYTYRWRPAAHLKAHIFRALDDTIFNVDWELRQPPRALRLPLDASQVQFFPAVTVEPRWDSFKRQTVAAELNQLNSFGRDAAGKAQALEYYRGLSNDAQRVLAGLTGNEQAFSQLTIQPLDPADPANADRRGPDSADTYSPDVNLRAYIDALDGRSTNRYFYRSAYVDGAHNRSPLSLSGPPVWLPNVVPPRAPVITKVLGGDRQITLRWASNREPDLAEYCVYRADREELTRDLRLMTLVHTGVVSAGDPSSRPAEVIWIHYDLLGGSRSYYRIVAVDQAGNISAPSEVFSAIAVDTRIPEPPGWLQSTWVVLRDADNGEEVWPADGIIVAGKRSALRLVWGSEVGSPTFLVTRRSRGDQSWRPIAAAADCREIAPTQFMIYDENISPMGNYSYRIRVTSVTGVSSIEYHEIEVARARPS